jgi:serine phosphatase RsbU (regulator of sigma subunit)
VTIANAGHLPPLVVGPDGADYVDAPIGPLIGVGTSAGYVTGTADVARHGTLLCYTDGLVERRDEGLDIGLERLKVSAGARSGTVEDTVSTVVRDVGPEIHDDDIAILAVRWLD